MSIIRLRRSPQEWESVTGGKALYQGPLMSGLPSPQVLRGGLQCHRRYPLELRNPKVSINSVVLLLYVSDEVEPRNLKVL